MFGIPRFKPVLFLLAFASVSAAAARAQAAIYATAGIANYGFSHLSSSDITSKGDTAGFAVGAFYNFPIQSRVTGGVDGRFGVSPGDKGGSLAGAALRVGFVPHRNPLRPFFQIGGGVVHSSYNEIEYFYNGLSSSTTTTRRSVTSGAAQFMVGLDIRLSDQFDLRAPEYGAQAGGGSGVAAERPS
jgi:hypothetical protein